MSTLSKKSFCNSLFSRIFKDYPIVKINNPESETAIAVIFTQVLVDLTQSGDLRAVWFHVANEYSGERNPRYGLMQRAQGKMSGCADYIFMHNNGALAIEIKTKSGKQTDSQGAFQEWCQSEGVPYVVCRSAEDAVLELKKSDIALPPWKTLRKIIAKYSP